MQHSRLCDPPSLQSLSSTWGNQHQAFWERLSKGGEEEGRRVGWEKGRRGGEMLYAISELALEKFIVIRNLRLKAEIF